jgi:O-antigen/teichoic acid export membrane protein
MSLRSKYEPKIRSLQGSDTAKAGGLALAMIVNNVIALGSTVVFARLLSDYGSLAALVSYFLILSVVGQAMQVATAREGVLGNLGVGHDLLATLRRWTQTMAIFTVVLTVVSVLLRNPIASAVGVKHDPWAAAIGIPAGCLWLELSILRGALQGVGDYKSVGLSLIYEQASRLATGAVLAAIGLGVTGAYLGTPLSFIVMCGYCALQLRRHVEQTTGTKVEPGKVHAAAIELWTHVRRAWVPIAGLIVFAVLQNIDIIAAKHRLPGKELQSSYAATAVAAKVLIWVAIGASFYLVPEVSRRGAEGKPTRPVLFRALGIIFVCAIPVLGIFAVAAKPLLKIAFGANRTAASDSLIVLGVAFAILACTYLAIQYMLAQKRSWFLLPIGLVAVTEPILLLGASTRPASFAAVVLGVQAAAAIVAFTIALWPTRKPEGGIPPGPDKAAPPSGETLDPQQPAPQPLASAGSTPRG